MGLKDKELEKIDRCYNLLDGMEKATHLVYHYRTLEGFWKIIEGDSFWATNARFSNDEEEQRLGMKLLKDVYWKETSVPGNMDCYIVCFCEEDDKLSQWRGYAQNGVSIGFDFSNIRPFFVLPETEGDCENIVYNSCTKVAYFTQETGGDELSEWISFNKEDYEGDKKRLDRFLINRIPYIKHSGFVEESEYRLVFDGEGLGAYIRYRNSDGRKLPYIVIKCGSTTKRDNAVLRVLFDTSSKKGEELLKTIKKSWPSGMDIDIIECRKKELTVDSERCNGCIKARRFNLESDSICEWLPCANKEDRSGFIKEDAVIISDCKNQKELFMSLHNGLHEKYGDEAPKIWCEGHLPIRSITVGPNRDAESVRESIEHYCRHKAYWLMDVEIRNSKIPYRS